MLLKEISQAASFLEWGVASTAGSVGPLGTAGHGASACACPQQGGPGAAGDLAHSESWAW